MKYLNYHGEGAEGFLELDTVEKCSKHCLDMRGCVSFDFDHTSSPWKNTRCWIHQNELESWSDGNHFLKVPCPMQEGEADP